MHLLTGVDVGELSEDRHNVIKYNGGGGVGAVIPGVEGCGMRRGIRVCDGVASQKTNNNK